jgi:hypothetical protein
MLEGEQQPLTHALFAGAAAVGECNKNVSFVHVVEAFVHS